jgi:hypothetical protein
MNSLEFRKQLQIGNLIYQDLHIGEVVSVNDFGVAVKVLERSKQTTNSGWQSPIPLESNYLFLLRFTETENNKWEIQIFQETYLRIGFKEYPYYQIGVKGLFFTDMIRIDYVHQVQNLLSSLLPKTL